MWLKANTSLGFSRHINCGVKNDHFDVTYLYLKRPKAMSEGAEELYLLFIWPLFAHIW